MPRNLETGWYRAAQSGDTVDGREINEQDILDMAETYDPAHFTALIWPEHYRYVNFGKVTQVRAEKNDKGGLDLFVKFTPNDYYLQYNDAGQKIFLSIELKPNFANSGKTYLGGLGATDDPASVATSEVRFSRIGAKEKDVFISTPIEAISAEFEGNTSEEQTPGWFNTFLEKHFNKEKSDMKPEDIKKLEDQFAALAKKVDALGGDETTDNVEPESNPQFAALEKQFSDLSAKIEGIESKQAGNDTNKKLYSDLKTDIDELTKQFKAALNEQPGTGTDEDTGGDANKIADCI